MKQIYNEFILLAAILFAISPIIVYCLVLHKTDFAETSGDFGIFGDYVGGTVGTIVGVIVRKRRHKFNWWSYNK